MVYFYCVCSTRTINFNLRVGFLFLTLFFFFSLVFFFFNFIPLLRLCCAQTHTFATDELKCEQRRGRGKHVYGKTIVGVQAHWTTVPICLHSDVVFFCSLLSFDRSFVSRSLQSHAPFHVVRLSTHIQCFSHYFYYGSACSLVYSRVP